MLKYRKESGLNYNHKQKNKKTSWLNSSRTRKKNRKLLFSHGSQNKRRISNM